MSTPEDQSAPAPPVEAQTAGFSWRKLASWAAYAIAILFVLQMVAFMEFIPFFIPFIVVFGVVGWWVGRGGRASAIVLGVLAIIFIVMNLPFIIPALAIPASLVDFIATVWLLLAAITAVVAGFFASRSDAPSAGAGTFRLVVVGVAVLAAVVSVISTVTYDEAARTEGDLALTAEDIEFQPESLDGDSGTVAVFVTNNDPTFHTFTIDELDVHLDIPANTTARIEFDADSGDYEFYCVPHEQDMKGTLQVQ